MRLKVFFEAAVGQTSTECELDGASVGLSTLAAILVQEALHHPGPLGPQTTWDPCGCGASFSSP